VQKKTSIEKKENIFISDKATKENVTLAYTENGIIYFLFFKTFKNVKGDSVSDLKVMNKSA